ncbi:hypothetical protein HCUR_00670 [Holospora curviuscula]|uniref:Uncharacterized protein n=1 Tax=Holospora curviuscula TaxID=1082868 RepID=A0A2S5R9B4_9PROT|nr:hypothetical protein HCUR_00670 [Holospora curviuscula]
MGSVGLCTTLFTNQCFASFTSLSFFAKRHFYKIRSGAISLIVS